MNPFTMYYCFLEEMMAGTKSTNTEEIIVYIICLLLDSAQNVTFYRALFNTFFPLKKTRLTICLPEPKSYSIP